MSLQIVITDAGRAEIINAEKNGTAPVTISEIGFGSGQYTASAAQTALQSEFKRLSAISGAAVGDDTIHISSRDESSDAYQVYEFGLYLDSGTLFAVYSQNTYIIDKTTVSIALLSVDIALQSINPASITFGDSNFINPPASTNNEGVVELATNDEVQSGTDTQRVITPASLSSRTATTSRTGLVELATNSETQTGSDSNRAVTPSSLSSRTATDTRSGLVELATNTETQNGSDSSRAVTPSSLSSRTATTERTGLVELANNLEALSGTDTSRAITPKGAHDAFKQYGYGNVVKPNQLSTILQVDSAIVEGSYSVKGVSEMPIQRFGHLEVKSTGFSRTFQIWRPIVTETSNYSEFGRLSTDGGVTWTPFTEIYNAATIPNSNTSVKGIVELATNEETQTGTDSSRAVTPNSLSSRTATTTRTGLVELANSAESIAGTDSVRAVTPAGVKAAIENNAPIDASTTTKGIIELATNAETQTGTDSTRAVTPASLASKLATTSAFGLTRLATDEEAEQASSSLRALTPSGLGAYASSRNLYGEDNNEMTGSVAYFVTTVSPDGWIKANGAAVSRTTYEKLFAKVGTFWGAGNGSTTFNLPDLRGEFIRSWDDGRGIDSARAFGTFQADEFKEHRHSLPSRDNDANGNSYVEDANSGGIVRTAYTSLEGGTETRPRNVALVAYIKY